MKKYTILVILAIFQLAYFQYSDAQADTLTVTNLNDSGPGSLRDTIVNVANPGDEIVFDSTLVGETIFLSSGFIQIFNKSLTITGPSNNPITIDASTNLSSGIFFIQGLSNVVISNLVLANTRRIITLPPGGGAGGFGGAINHLPGGSLEINDCTFINNGFDCRGGTSCAFSGGAIGTISDLTINRSTFVDNYTTCTNTTVCSTQGGAIFTAGLPTDTVIENSTFYNNEVRCNADTCNLVLGGALSSNNPNGNITMNNNTFSNNEATCQSSTCLDVVSSIFTILSVNAKITNSIITNSQDSTAQNCSGTLDDGGNNIQYPDTSCGNTIPVVDPLLGPLANNGGITETMAITEESPAFNAGNNETCLDIDQRGIDRPQDVICDIGSYELIVKNVPTLSEWGLIAMAGILGIVGLIVIRRRKALA